MATSGEHNFALDLGEIIEEAFERAGLELRSGYDYRTARRSLNLLTLEWQNRGLNLWTVQEDSFALTAGQSRYPLDSDALDIVEAAVRTGTGDSQLDIALERMSISQYAQMAKKNMETRPNQFWVERDPGNIAVNLWPTPGDDEDYTLVYWYMQQIEDTGDPAENTMGVPVRFLPAMVAGLAYYIATKRPETGQRAPLLKQVYDEQFELAADAHRNKASLWVSPGGYW